MTKIRLAQSAAPARVFSAPAVAKMEVVVIYTGVKNTLAALRAAAGLAQGLSARIRLVVPQSIPFPAQLDEPPVRRDFAERKFRTLAEQSSIETTVEIRVCRDWEAGALDGLKPGSIVIMGAGMRWWPALRERRLARTLQKLGHRALLVGSN
ncbi:MAG TPA: hypothetical protein VN893_08510 [Bryobacteraceae bacterium]|nr:hypothetical protein [Bryobacteraceae bacterium]